MEQRKVGELTCQQNSFCRHLDGRVIASRVTDSGFEVELDDSVIFPEGGGQPCDYGLLEYDNRSINVIGAFRRGLYAVLMTDQLLPEGAIVHQSVDWPRRFDHMQQHTGQHLISAMFDTVDIETLSWCLGKREDYGCGLSYIELPCKPSQELIETIQARCNEHIRDAIKIHVESIQGMTGDSLPKDYDAANGVTRIISIDSLDRNPCCGTHLTSTAQLNLISLYHTTTVRSTHCRLYFAAGERAISNAAVNATQLRDISAKLSSTNALGRIEKLLNDCRTAQRESKRMAIELAESEWHRFKEMYHHRNGDLIVHYHREDPSIDFVNTFISKAKGNVNMLFTSGGVGAFGSIIVLGEENIVQETVKTLQRLLPSLKGNGKGIRWQGKVIKWEKAEFNAVCGAFQNTASRQPNVRSL